MFLEQKIKKNINLCFIFTIIALCLEVFLLAMYIYWGDAVDIIDSGISICLDIFLLCVFATLKNKDIEYISQKKGLIWACAIITIFASSLIVMIFVFMVNNQIRQYQYEKMMRGRESAIPVEKVEEKMPEVSPAEELVARLKTLQNMRNNGEITEEENEQLKQKMIAEFKDSTTK